MRHDGQLTTTLDVVVSPEDDAEVRRVSIVNGGAGRDIELTSYAEIVLATPLADALTRPSPSSSCRPNTCRPPAPRWRRVVARPDEPELWARAIWRSSRARRSAT